VSASRLESLTAADLGAVSGLLALAQRIASDPATPDRRRRMHAAMAELVFHAESLRNRLADCESCHG
jgi:hypothetical protein